MSMLHLTWSDYAQSTVRVVEHIEPCRPGASRYFGEELAVRQTHELPENTLLVQVRPGRVSAGILRDFGVAWAVSARPDDSMGPLDAFLTDHGAEVRDG